MLASEINIVFSLFLCRAKLVDIALASGKIFEGEGFNYIKECFDQGTLHLIGLLSDGGVHSRLDQVQVWIGFRNSLLLLYDEALMLLYHFVIICYQLLMSIILLYSICSCF